MTSAIQRIIPFAINGEVTRGFGRGNKELGIPTANLPSATVDQLPDSVNCGTYFGWAQVNQSPVYKMVMSVGWNPYYKNEKKSVEVHILHEFETDFYGETLYVLIVGYIRPEKNFASVDELIAEIQNDIVIANEMLNKPEYKISFNGRQNGDSTQYFRC